MRALFAFLCVFILVGCNDSADDCLKLWQLEKSQISAFANTDGEQLHFEVWNASGPNSIKLEQTGLSGDFQMNIDLLSLEADSPSVPQFRFEIFDESAPYERYAGVAIQPDIFFCYVGSSQPEDRDNRLAEFNQCVLRVSRLNDTVTCFSEVNGIALTMSDTFTNDALGVRLVLGAVEHGLGAAHATLDNFQISSESNVRSDDFNCLSW